MPQKVRILASIVVLALAARGGPLPACTNILVTKGASADGSTFITYAADSHDLYGELSYRAGGAHRPDAVRDIFDWDTGKLLGSIPEASVTYTRVGNMNEHQVAIGETTFGGREELAGPSGMLDYGSLIYVALERSRTAREAIGVMAALVEEHGYSTVGESFSISDPEEVWILEMIGKGKGAKGAVWAALKVPDGSICAHANQSRIRRIPLDDPKGALFSKDVIAFAREKGWFKGDDRDFSFADAYAPPNFESRRICEGRVWSVFRRACPSRKIPLDYVKSVPGAEPLPLWVTPDRKLGARDVMELMRDHFGGTELDMTKDVGAGPFRLPYRWRPLTFGIDGKEYFHERAISTQQTGFSFVAQSRSWLPAPIGGVLWFGVDDTYCTVYVPMYCGIREAPRGFAHGDGSWNEFSWDSAFWIFNFVSNTAYGRWSDMVVDLRKVQDDLEGKFLAEQAETDAAAKRLHEQSPGLARDYLTAYSARQAELTLKRWRKLGEFMIWKYLDGNVRDALGGVTHPRYHDDWYRRIVKERGEEIELKKAEASK
jgi:dipeptidase